MIEMIEGINVLNQYNVNCDASGWIIFGIILFFSIFSASVISEYWQGLFYLLIPILMFCYAGKISIQLDHVEYQVTINENVKMSEFTSKYVVIKQEGQIFTIKEKEQD